MPVELIVRPKTEIATHATRKDILALYEVPAMLDVIVKKEKIELLNKMNCGAVILESLNKLTHSEGFYVEIPCELREMLKTGKAAFDKSGKNPGSLTPNIRIKGETGIKGQATIVQKTDFLAVTQSISNLAMMAMVQSVLAKLDIIEEKLDDIKTGQKNDRIAGVIGSFKGFIDLYPTFKTPEELNNAANKAYIDMQNALAKLHLQIEEERKKLEGAPKNDFQAFWMSITHPLHNESKRYQKCYKDYVYDIQLYNRLILLADIILYLKGFYEVIPKNRQTIFKYLEQNIDDSFKRKMDYLMCGETEDITNILNYNKIFSQAFEGVNTNVIQIECKKEDVKHLNFI